MGEVTDPLRLVLLAAFCDGQRVDEFRVVRPELQFCETGSAGEEVEDAADHGLLFRGQVNAGAGVDVCVLNLQISCLKVSIIIHG